MKINIAIDGPSAAGKSTIAKKLAALLGYVHLDTGAMYRCTALKCVRGGIALDDEDAVCEMLKETEIVLTPEGGVYLDGEDVSLAVRADEISMAASKVSALKRVRSDLVARQQEMAKAGGFIMDGRDIGTVVLPDADVKIYLTASAEVRAKRRFLELQEQGRSDTYDEVLQDMIERDYRDMHRAVAPLKQADDAILLDTSELSLEESIEAILKIIRERLAL